MRDKIINAFKESISVLEQFYDLNTDRIIEVSHLLSDTFTRGDKVVLFGNGGSATDASHIAAELVNKFRKHRPGLPAIALNTDVAVLTSIANDYDYSEIFSRQIKALAQEGDVAIAISTSGNSPNVVKGVLAAKKKKVKVIALTGNRGGALAAKADYSFLVPSGNTPRIQEVHITLGHVLCQMVEEILFESHSRR